MNARRLGLAGAGAAALFGLGLGMLGRPGPEKDRAAAQPATRGNPDGIPNVALKTHTGKTVRFYDDLLRDKLVVINMMYAGCTNTCPPTTHNLLRVQQMLGDRVGKDIFMYSITLRPEQDAPLDLAAYARSHAVQPGWLFLTGSAEDIEQLRFALGFYDPDPKVDREEGRHVGMVRIGNDPYRRWGMAPALADPRQIVSSILHVDRKATRPNA
ncbi:SCO family protein [Ramlibacter henchirensis]|uniref:SCO family protein n=1 Tax=Ramlibacter henchirensis TaxID=204072 RepID=A0A4Z0BW35_9BURK|nr:SCO family protein [Ramlibacter henchirensis]TFZ03111.1 SCO family protein [Ramlibacter henchirensis]